MVISLISINEKCRKKTRRKSLDGMSMFFFDFCFFILLIPGLTTKKLFVLETNGRQTREFMKIHWTIFNNLLKQKTPDWRRFENNFPQPILKKKTTSDDASGSSFGLISLLLFVLRKVNCRSIDVCANVRRSTSVRLSCRAKKNAFLCEEFAFPFSLLNRSSCSIKIFSLRVN